MSNHTSVEEERRERDTKERATLAQQRQQQTSHSPSDPPSKESQTKHD